MKIRTAMNHSQEKLHETPGDGHLITATDVPCLAPKSHSAVTAVCVLAGSRGSTVAPRAVSGVPRLRWPSVPTVPGTEHPTQPQMLSQIQVSAAPHDKCCSGSLESALHQESEERGFGT